MGLKWDLLIAQEEKRMASFYRLANLFTDVPKLKDTVKRRKWLDIIHSTEFPFHMKIPIFTYFQDIFTIIRLFRTVYSINRNWCHLQCILFLLDGANYSCHFIFIFNWISASAIMESSSK